MPIGFVAAAREVIGDTAMYSTMNTSCDRQSTRISVREAESLGRRSVYRRILTGGSGEERNVVGSGG